MSEATLIRTVRFSAGHRYWRPEWGDERNREVFGASAELHEHSFALQVFVRGPVDGETGFVVDLEALDRLLREEVVEPLDRQDLTETIPAFRRGEQIPTTEALARHFFHALRERIPGPARLVRVRLHESDELASEYGEGHRGPGGD